MPLKHSAEGVRSNYRYKAEKDLGFLVIFNQNKKHHFVSIAATNQRRYAGSGQFSAGANGMSEDGLP
ncbi:MAG: hypothetical protein PHT25_00820 [Bacteroidales bacterium]|nr:hypothetical protein [Bacteroidales bacterium]